MLFARTLAIGASFVVAALAQSKIQFTTLPTAVTAGDSIDLKWIGGDNSPVTITLRQGPSTDLKDVAILTTSGTAGSFVWTPSKSLPDGSNYALQISQGSVVNYSGQFSLSGGSGSTIVPTGTKSSSASVSASSSASVSKSSSASVTAPATTVSLTSAQNSTVVATTKIPLNGTIPVVGTGASFGSSGIPITRNGTLSRATLTATKSSAASSTAGSGGAEGSGGAGGSSAGSNPSKTGAPKSNSAANLASPLALFLCALVAVVYFG